MWATKRPYNTQRERERERERERRLSYSTLIKINLFQQQLDHDTKSLSYFCCKMRQILV
jgi:hypothetical protein